MVPALQPGRRAPRHGGVVAGPAESKREARVTGQTPLVSIGMPVYNGERFIRPALDSLLAQTHRDFELIISDNVSTDATAEICQAYAARDPRIRYSRLATHVSAIENFDRALGLARGEYFMWAAADDLWEPGFVSTLLTLLQGSPEAVLAFSVLDTVDDEGATIEVYTSALQLPSSDRVVRLRNFLLQEETRGKPNLIYGLMRRHGIKIAGGFMRWGPHPWGADMLLVFRLLSYGDLAMCRNLLFHKRLPDRRLKARPESEGHTVWRHLQGIRGWWALFSGYARLIARDDHLQRRDKVRLQAALLKRVAQI